MSLNKLAKPLLYNYGTAFPISETWALGRALYGRIVKCPCFFVRIPNNPQNPSTTMLRYHIVVAHLTLMALLRAGILPVTDSYSVHLHYLRLIKEWLETLDMERRFRADPAVLDHQILENITTSSYAPLSPKIHKKSRNDKPID